MLSAGLKAKLGKKRISHFLGNKSSLADDLRLIMDSPYKSNPKKHVVIVMDGLEEFTTELLEWVLANLITSTGCIVTLLGVMPWLNLPLSTKTWLDVWSVEFGVVRKLVSEKSDWIKSDFKYLKLKEVIDLCKSYGVVLQKKVVMGYPSRLLVVEQITSLSATWVVFDRYQRQVDLKFYAKKIPCNMVVMNGEGEFDMIKGRSVIKLNRIETSNPGESPPSTLPTPKLVISDRLKGILKERSQGHYYDLDDDEKEVYLSV
ncbi:hypothetical protein TIFTF001_002878 [Ficus carica]|uniref:Uncharacterized protein n=1 Tax=Ficus carica TaxID=3494 RepID=A0AA87ZDM6_FICCA|nr:hypothetical protein TIFTF001_002878 [Ficus carica]